MKPCSTIELINRLTAEGVELRAEGDRLGYKSPGVLLAARKAEIAECRDNLVSVLRDPAAVSRYPLTPPQRQLWAWARFSGHVASDHVYSTSVLLRCAATLDRERLDQAFSDLVRRHEVIRSEASLDGRHLFVLPARGVAVEWLPPSPSPDELLAAVTERLEHVRTFGPAPQLRLIAGTTAQETVIVLGSHHMWLDGTSLGQLANELCDLYSGHDLSELPAAIPFHAFVEARQRSRATPSAQASSRHWTAMLERLPNASGAAPRTFKAKRWVVPLAASWSQLEALSRGMAVSSFAVVLAVCVRVAQASEALGSQLAGVAIDARKLVGCNRAVGYCSEVYPIGIRTEGLSLASCCQEAQRVLWETLNHHASSLSDVLEQSPELSRRIDLAVTMADLSTAKLLEGRAVSLEPGPAPYRDTPFSVIVARAPGDRVDVAVYAALDRVSEGRGYALGVEIASQLDGLARDAVAPNGTRTNATTCA